MSLEQARSSHERGDLRTAEKAYRRVLAREPRRHEALSGLALVMHERGHDESAAAMLAKAVTLSPERFVYRYQLAEVLRSAGRYEDAIDAYRAAISRRADHADSFFGLGNALAEAGRGDEAVEAYRRAASLAPGDAEIHNNLGNALADAGQTGDALEHLRRAVSLRPGYADAHHNLSLVLGRTGPIEEALAHARKACALDGIRAQPMINLGRLMTRAGTSAAAIACLGEAIRRAGNDPGLLADAADGLCSAGDPGRAADVHRRLIERHPRAVEHRTALCRCLVQLHRFDEAEEEARRALEMAPEHAPALTNLAACLQTRGAFDEAAELLRRARRASPSLGVVPYLLATNGAQEIPDAEFDQWRALAEDPGLGAEQRYHLHFAIARVHERRANPDDAFRHFREANAIKAARLPFDAAGHAAYVRAIRSLFTAAFFARRAEHGIDDQRPVFIVGMPRSGSTLVEQILARHPQVAALGEHPAMRHIVRELPEVTHSGRPVPDCCDDLPAKMSISLARRYLSSLPSWAAGATRATDKMLGNFLRLGVIALLFPRARVIHCTRDPLDTCVSCFTQDFDHGLRFSTDLAHLAAFYRDYHALMAHWHRVLPLPIMDVSYEALVDDPERQARALLDFCELRWDDRCLRPELAERRIATASVWQARQPVHADSVGRWRRYAAHLGPLIEPLREAGIVERT